MKREFLTGLGLEKDAIESIMAEHGKSLEKSKEAQSQLADLNAKLTEAQAEVTNLTSIISTRDADIEKLKEASGTSETLTAQLSELQKKYDTDKVEHEKVVKQTKKEAAIEIALTNAKARNNKAVKALLDVESIEFDNDKLKGLDKQLEALKEESAFLFEQSEPQEPPANPTPQIVTPGNPGPPPEDTRDPFVRGLGIKAES